MKKYVIGFIGCALFAHSIQAIDLFNRLAKEMDTNFLRPLSEMRNTLENTAKIFKGVESPTDRIRVSGGFMREMGQAMDKITSFIEYINDKFINSLLSKKDHAKVKEVINEAHAVSGLLQHVADQMRMYRMNEQMKVEVAPEDIPGVVDVTLDTD